MVSLSGKKQQRVAKRILSVYPQKSVANKNKSVIKTSAILEQNKPVIKTKEGVMLMKKAIYAASFDPFTNGHLDILKTAADMFDEVHVVLAVNADKTRKYNQIYMKEAIEKIIENNGLTNCKVFIHNGLVAQYCTDNNIGYTVRGLRNFFDYEYEEKITKINKRITPNLKTVYLPAEHDDISSSSVKELYGYGIDVSDMVPAEILPILRTFN